MDIREELSQILQKHITSIDAVTRDGMSTWNDLLDDLVEFDNRDRTEEEVKE